GPAAGRHHRGRAVGRARVAGRRLRQPHRRRGRVPRRRQHQPDRADRRGGAMTSISYHQHGHHQPRAGAARVPAYALPQRVSQGRVIRAEWTKLRTQPSALWAGAASAGLTAGFGILYSLLREARPPHGAAAVASFDPTAISLSGIQLAQIAVGVLGAMLITSEYSSGMIRSTFAAVPRRLPALWGKVAVALG